MYNIGCIKFSVGEKKNSLPTLNFYKKTEQTSNPRSNYENKKRRKNTCSKHSIKEVLRINDIHTLNQINLHRQYWGFYITYIDDIIFLEKEFSTNTKI